MYTKSKMFNPENASCSFHYILGIGLFQFEEPYHSMKGGFQLFDELNDGYIGRSDFRRVLKEFGFSISVPDMDYFFSRYQSNCITIIPSEEVIVTSTCGDVHRLCHVTGTKSSPQMLVYFGKSCGYIMIYKLLWFIINIAVIIIYWFERWFGIQCIKWVIHWKPKDQLNTLTCIATERTANPQAYQGE